MEIGLVTPTPAASIQQLVCVYVSALTCTAIDTCALEGMLQGDRLCAVHLPAVSTIAVDVLATQGARASAAMVLT